jgi:DNA-binding IscR family transcriptional regulator
VSLNFYKKCDDCEESVCGLNKMMVQVRDATLKILEEKSLADIMHTTIPSDLELKIIDK